MRFLFTLGLLCVVGVSSQCIPKTATQSIHAGTNFCESFDTPTNFDVITGSPVTIPVPKWDPSAHPGAVLDAVYVNAIVADYAPTGTYRIGNVGDAPGTVTVELAVPTTWNFFSNVDNRRLKKLNLNNLIGWGTVNNGATDAVLTGCINGHGNDFAGVALQCIADYSVLGQPFSIRDYRYKTTQIDPVDVGTNIQFRADYSQPNTFTDFASYDADASNGFQLAASNVGAGVSGYQGSGNWGLVSAINDGTTPTAIDGQVITTSSGPSIANNIVHHFYIWFEVQYDYHVPAGGSGDPQFAGFQGQSFQVHGAPDSYFALISAPSYYVNARFDYISTGSCTYNETACFTHPGTYMGMIFVGMRDANILIQAGPHSTGFASVLVNDKPMTSGDRYSLQGVSADSYIQVASQSKLILSLDNILITVHNSDLFVNFDLALTDKELLATGSVPHTIPSGSTPSQVQHHLNKWYGTYNPLHGLIGQTWRNVKYQDHKLYQGDITEYQLDKIVDHTFLYCVYQA